MRLVIVGGCGHVGLPLAIVLAQAGVSTVAMDVAADKVELVRSGRMPFLEGGDPEKQLQHSLESGMLQISDDPAEVADADVVVVVIGTPVDEHLNPDPNEVSRALRDIVPYMKDGQLLILRSTVFPGVSARVERVLAESSLKVDVAFCPERIAEGHALEELRSLPQLIGARNDEAFERAKAVFDVLGVTSVPLVTEEAELAKLLTNTWRYIKFAAANQFYMMANDAGLDYSRILEAIRYEYPRANDIPSAGFAAGPCLLKDTMQLAAFTNNNFLLGHSAMLVNEGLPLYVVERLEREIDLTDKTVGVLGMAFKGGSDDTRSSLSYKLKRVLRFKALNVITSDPYVTDDPELMPLDKTVEMSDLLIIAAPHPEYVDLRAEKRVVDIWGIQGGGTLV